MLVESSIAGVVTSTRGEPLEDIQATRSESATADLGTTARSLRSRRLTPGDYELVATQQRSPVHAQGRACRPARATSSWWWDVATIVGRHARRQARRLLRRRDPRRSRRRHVRESRYRPLAGRSLEQRPASGALVLRSSARTFCAPTSRTSMLSRARPSTSATRGLARAETARHRRQRRAGRNAIVALTTRRRSRPRSACATLMARDRCAPTRSHYEIDGIASDAQQPAAGERRARRCTAARAHRDRRGRRSVLVRTGAIDGIVVNMRPHRARRRDRQRRHAVLRADRCGRRVYIDRCRPATQAGAVGPVRSHRSRSRSSPTPPCTRASAAAAADRARRRARAQGITLRSMPAEDGSRTARAPTVWRRSTTSCRARTRCASSSTCAPVTVASGAAAPDRAAGVQRAGAGGVTPSQLASIGAPSSSPLLAGSVAATWRMRPAATRSWHSLISRAASRARRGGARLRPV